MLNYFNTKYYCDSLVSQTADDVKLRFIDVIKYPEDYPINKVDKIKLDNNVSVSVFRSCDNKVKIIIDIINILTIKDTYFSWECEPVTIIPTLKYIGGMAQDDDNTAEIYDIEEKANELANDCCRLLQIYLNNLMAVYTDEFDVMENAYL